MTRKELERIKRAYRNGSFVRITYLSDPPLKASAKKRGIVVQKKTETTSRFGCKYANLPGVEVKGAYDYAHSDDGIIYVNKKSGVEYLQLAPIHANMSTKVQWLLNGKVTSKEDVLEYIQPSYFNRKSEDSPVIRVKLENIIRIKQKGT